MTPTRHTPEQEQPSTSEAIRAAAFQLFGEHGFGGTSVRAIAKVAGIDPALVIRHFGSKEALFLSTVEAEVERLITRLDAADRRTAGAPLHQRAAALALALLDHATRQPAAFRLLHVTARHRDSKVAADVDRALGRVPDRIAAALRRDLHDWRVAEIDSAARALHGAAAGMAAGGLEDRKAAAATLGRGLAAGLRPAAPEPSSPKPIELGVY